MMLVELQFLAKLKSPHSAYYEDKPEKVWMDKDLEQVYASIEASFPNMKSQLVVGLKMKTKRLLLHGVIQILVRCIITIEIKAV